MLNTNNVVNEIDFAWPSNWVSTGVIENSNYLSFEQKRDILFNNAVRFLGWMRISLSETICTFGNSLGIEVPTASCEVFVLLRFTAAFLCVLCSVLRSLLHSHQPKRYRLLHSPCPLKKAFQETDQLHCAMRRPAQ